MTVVLRHVTGTEPGVFFNVLVFIVARSADFVLIAVVIDQ